VTPQGLSRLPSNGRTRLLLVLACSFAIVQLRALWAGGPPIGISFLSLFASFAYASIGFHYLLAPVAASRHLIIGLMLLMLAVALAFLVAQPANPIWVAKSILIGLGALGILGYTRDILATHSPVRLDRLASLRDALIVPLAVVQVPFFLWTNAQLNPVYDALVFGFEDRLRVPFSYVAMQSYSLAEPFSVIATGCYLGLPIGLSVLGLKQLSSSATSRVLWAVVLAGVCGFALYAICPVVGPVQAFSAPFPVRIPHPSPAEIAPLRVIGHVPRNGMPSLHTVWALLMVFNTRGLAFRWRAAFLTFAVLNVWAAIGHYQHWFMDLVVAVPLAVAIHLAISSARSGSSHAPRISSAAWAALTLLWLLGLRRGFFLEWPTWLAWLAVVLTVALPLWSVARTSVPNQVPPERF
jgi:hypothetical protein